MITISVSSETVDGLRQDLTSALNALSGAPSVSTNTEDSGSVGNKTTEKQPKAEKQSKGEKPKDKPPASSGVDLARLRELGQQLIKQGRQAELKAVVTNAGSESLSTLDKSKYQAVHDELENLLLA